jgi:hypothetical protein
MLTKAAAPRNINIDQGTARSAMNKSALQARRSLVSLSHVRVSSGLLLLLLLLLLLPARLQAQEQESKLVSRLLRPDMTLQNHAQKKKFVATSVVQDRQASVRKFSWQEKSNSKTFSNTGEFFSSQFYSGSPYRTKDSKSLTDKAAQKSNLAFGTHTATGMTGASDSDKKSSSRDFPGNRPFLDQGKSQKILSQKSRPMTIEEVRELLNKNK